MRRLLALTALVIIMVAGCSYTSQTVLPDYITKINLKPVKNTTFYSGLGEKLTVQLSQELASDNRIHLVDQSNADAVLSVEIYHYNKKAVEVDERGRAREYEITLTTKVTLFDQIKNQIFWSEEKIEDSAEYTTSLSSVNDLASEVEGIDEALENLALDIAHRVIYGW